MDTLAALALATGPPSIELLNRPDETDRQSTEIDGQLELQETSDVIINISTPHTSFHYRSKVIILNNNSSGRVSD